MTARKKKQEAPLLALATPVPTDREKIWAAIRQEKTFTLTQLAHLTGCREHKVKDYVRGLVASGHVRRPEGAKLFTKTEYILAQDTGVDAPRVRLDGTVLPASGRTRMWNAMRILKVFTVDDLVNAASLPEASIAEGEAEYYCKWLVYGGYLGSGGGVFHFIPAKYTGAKAPQILRIKALFDPNLGAVVYQPAAEGRDDE
jgi:hypothetical protein